MAPERYDLTADGIDDGELVTTLNEVDSNANGDVFARHVSARLPLGALTLFEDGTVDVADLSDGERAWIRAESGARSNEVAL